MKNNSIEKYVKRTLIAFTAVPAFLIAAFAVGLWWPLSSVNAVNTETPIISPIVDVKAGTLQAEKTVLVENRRIAAIANANEITTPPAAQFVDGRNHFDSRSMGYAYAYL